MQLEISDLEISLKKLLIDGYSQEELREFVNNVAVKVELFLKRDVFPMKSNRDNFIAFIDELKTSIADTSLVEKFHDIRKLYNKAKHEPTYIINISEAIDAISSIKPTITEICRQSLGQTNDPVRVAATRVFWICAWDHIIHGETEIVIFIPSEYDGFLGARSLDLVHIKCTEWETFKTELTFIGNVHPYDKWIPQGQTEFWFSEGDCLTPLVFEGDFKSLLSCLAKYESEAEGRLPGLSRTDCSQNLFQSCMLATLDIATSSQIILNNEISTITNLVNNQYAVPISENSRVENFVTQIVNLIEEIPTANQCALTGPFWVTAEELHSIESYAINTDIHTAIDKNNRVLLGVK